MSLRCTVAAFATLAVGAACTGDDEDGAASTSPRATATATTTTTATEPATNEPAPPSASSAPTTSISSTTVAPPARLDELSVALVGASDVGVPDTWAIRDLDPAVMDPVTVIEADPFQGLVSCPPAAIRSSDAWLQRTFAAPEDPLDSGLLSVDIIVEIDDEAAAAAGRAALAECTPVGPDTSIEATEVQLTPIDAAGVEAGPALASTEVVVTSGPSADVPYPSAATVVSAHRDGRTVSVFFGGLDLGVPLSDAARDLAARLLGRFD